MKKINLLNALMFVLLLGGVGCLKKSILFRCLEKSPDRRFESAAELRQALETLDYIPNSSLS